jgi:hypothetical protein
MKGGALTAPSQGLDARVGNEMGEWGGWLMRRTKDVEELLAQPAIMALVDRVAEHCDRVIEVREIAPKELEVSLLPTQTLRYITIQVASNHCESCGGVGYFFEGPTNRRCSKCEGTGRQ